MKNTIFLLLVAFALSFSGCAAIDRVGDYVGENPAFTNLAARQVTARVITADEENEVWRAARIHNGVDKILALLDGSPVSTVGAIMVEVDRQIDWSKLSKADAILVRDLVTILQAELVEQAGDDPALSDKSVVAIRALLETIQATSELYL